VTLTLVFNRGQRDACVIRSCRLAEKKTYLAEQVDVGVRIAPAPKQSVYANISSGSAGNVTKL
jgi:hypothetical protein